MPIGGRFSFEILPAVWSSRYIRVAICPVPRCGMRKSRYRFFAQSPAL